MAISNKIDQWRNKNEQEKHIIAVIGSIIFTLVIVFVWGVTFMHNLGGNIGNNIVEVKNKEYNEQFSPLASLKNLFSDSIQKIKSSGEDIKGSASAIFGGEVFNSN